MDMLTTFLFRAYCAAQRKYPEILYLGQGTGRRIALTFDDGPWVTTPHVLKALADECVKATFFPIGKHATYYPEILRQVAAAGHTVGSHTWSHKDLSRKPYTDIEKAKEEIELGVSAVAHALGRKEASFFRFPALRHPPELVKYMGQRNIAMFSTDMDSFDFKMRKPEQVVNAVMTKLKKFGKGIVLMHDIRRQSIAMLGELLPTLIAEGYRFVTLDEVPALDQYRTPTEETAPEDVPIAMYDGRYPLTAAAR